MTSAELAALIQEYFIAQKWTLGIAESCTGGNLAACFTQVPGCSQYFLGSIVAYSNQLKTQILGVNSSLLDQHGAVSGVVATQMVQGALKLFNSEYALAITGIAGPGGASPSKPVGTIWMAVGRQNQVPFVWALQLSGSRQEIIHQSIDAMLLQLWVLIETQKKSMEK